MVLLSLLRHAKSDWTQGIQSDHDRPLAPRGEKAAPLMGRHIAASGRLPDTVLCSTAVRARQTLDLVLKELPRAPRVEYLAELYHAGPAAIIECLSRLPDSCGHSMVVGHNPGLQQLALELASRSDLAEVRTLVGKFPTAGLALYQFGGNWPDLGAKPAKLLEFVTPRGLGAP